MRLLLFLLFFSTSLHCWASEKHLIFIIHGLTGAPENFCGLDKLLVENLDDPLIEAVYLKYDTEDEKLEVSDFTKAVAQQIRESIVSRNLDINTPYSIIAHSQGGIISMKYAQRCIVNGSNSCGETAKNMKQLITLGTPFWSSPNANWLASRWGLSIPFFPDQQVKGLNSSSRTLVNLRKQAIHQGEQEFWQNFRLYNIAGEIKYNRDLVDHGFENAVLNLLYSNEETDIAVPPSSAKFDFHYSIEKSSGGYKNGTTHFVNQYVVFPIPHTNLISTQGMTCFEKKDNNYSYKHILPYITDIYRELLYGQEYDIPDYKIQAPIKNFAVEIRLKTPSDIKRSFNVNKGMVKIYEVEEDPEKQMIENPLINDGIVSLHTQFVARNEPSEHSSFYHTGRFKSEYSYNPKKDGANKTKINYEIKVPGFRTQNFYLYVEPGSSSYAEINLEPFRPLRSGKRESYFFENGESKKIVFMVERNRVRSDEKPYLVGIISENDQSFLITQWDEDQWLEHQERLGEGSDLEDFQNNCFIGQTGHINRLHKNALYEKPFDKKPIGHHRPGMELVVLGRYSSSNAFDQNGEAIDRYLILYRHPYFASGPGDGGLEPRWINVKDLDIVSKDSICD